MTMKNNIFKQGVVKHSPALGRLRQKYQKIRAKLNEIESSRPRLGYMRDYLKYIIKQTSNKQNLILT